MLLQNGDNNVALFGSMWDRLGITPAWHTVGYYSGFRSLPYTPLLVIYKLPQCQAYAGNSRRRRDD